MIPKEERQILLDFLAAEIRSTAPDIDLETHEIAEAIFAFLELENVPHPVSTELLGFIGARCLHGLHHSEAADRFLAGNVHSEAGRLRCREFLSIRPFSYRLWQLLDAGVLEFGKATETSARPHYVLNLSLVPMEAGDLELTFFMTLKKVIEEFRGLWTRHAGAFHLMLKGLPATRGRAKTLPNTDGVLEYCRELLLAQGRAESWADQPEIQCDLRARL